MTSAILAGSDWEQSPRVSDYSHNGTTHTNQNLFAVSFFADPNNRSFKSWNDEVELHIITNTLIIVKVAGNYGIIYRNIVTNDETKRVDDHYIRRSFDKQYHF